MVAHFFKNSEKILVVGPIYDKIEKLEKAIKLIPNYDLTIFNGNLCYPFDEIKTKQRLDLMDKLLENKKVIYNIGNLDYKLMLKHDFIEKWLANKPNIIFIEFKRGSTLIVSCGGISNKMDKDILKDNIEVTFLSMIGDKSWHNYYNGKIGYVISNSPFENKAPEFYNYSCRIGNNLENEEVYAQEADANGLLMTIVL